MQDADDQTGYKGKDYEFYKKCYHFENKTDEIAEYYKAMAESDARRDKEEKRRQKELKAQAEEKLRTAVEGPGLSQQADKIHELKPIEGN